MLNYVPKLDDFMNALKNKRVFACEDDHYIGFKYNEPTIYAQDWNDVTLQARGIVFDKDTGEIVARPFFKFFNYSELINGQGEKTNIYNLNEKYGFHFDPSLRFRVMDKLDGSLGIIFWDKYSLKWKVKTGGSFDSTQAVWGQKWFDANVNTKNMNKAYTYCVEILMKEDLHPISYDKEELVLLSVISNATGEELSLDFIEQSAKEMNIRAADVIQFNSFDEVIPYATNLPNTKEGVVVTFENGFKVKLKGKEFLELQKKFHNFTEKAVWEQFKIISDARFGTDCWPADTIPWVEYVESIPEEMQDLRDYSDHLLSEYMSRIISVANDALKIYETESERVEQWKMANEICTNKDLLPAVMKAIGNLNNIISAVNKVVNEKNTIVDYSKLITPNIREIIYKSLKP